VKDLRQDTLLTSYEAGSLLQADPSSVNKWVKEGRLPACHTPGGHSRIMAHDLVAFMHQLRMPVPQELTKIGQRLLLVVDDDPLQLRAMQRMLKPYAPALEVRFADNGVEALVQVGLFRPHAVLLDVVMPNLDGIEVCRRFKAMNETRDISVIVNSAHLTPEMEEQAKAAGAVRCLHKPVDVGELLELLGVNLRSTTNIRDGQTASQSSF